MKGSTEAIAEMIGTVENIMAGTALKKSGEDYPPELAPLAEKIMELGNMVSSVSNFAEELTRGNMDADPPGRENFFAAPLKRLQSQLLSLEWSMEQLMRGNIVSKLNYPGTIYETYNKFIEKVSHIFGGTPPAELDWGTAATSWRYHQLLAAINNLNIMLIETDMSGRILFANPSAKAVFSGSNLKNGVGARAEDKALWEYMDSFYNRAPRDGDIAIQPAVQGDQAFMELYVPSSNLWYKITSNIVKLADGELGIVHMVDNISEWKSKEYHLKIKATIDALTGAFTRKEGMDRLAELLKNPTSKPNCAAFIDVDNLKTINDKHGHTEGDYAIKLVAEVLMNNVRETDWVVRFGGDEFIVLFLNFAENTASRMLERINKQLEDLNRESGKPFSVSVSIGLCEIDDTMKDSKDVINEIDRRMYENKTNKKRNAVQIDPES